MGLRMAKFRYKQYDATVFFNCRVKEYPNGDVEILCCDKNIFNPSGLERAKDSVDTVAVGTDSETVQPREGADNRAVRRAQKQMQDYILCNDFTHFVTFTLDGAKIDRTNWADIVRPLNKWLGNRVARKGLKYILVAEYHKKSNGIHFHGLVNDTLEFVDSGTVSVQGVKKPVKVATYNRKYKGSPCHTVYNVADWEYGFTTAIRLYGDRMAVARYVGKYLEKDFAKIGGRYYMHSHNLDVPKVSYLNTDFSGFDGTPFNFNDVNIWWKIQRITAETESKV